MAFDTSINVTRSWVLGVILAVIAAGCLIAPAALKWDKTQQIFGYSLGGALAVAAAVVLVRGIVGTVTPKASQTEVSVTVSAVLNDFEWMVVGSALALGLLVGFILKMAL